MTTPKGRAIRAMIDNALGFLHTKPFADGGVIFREAVDSAAALILERPELIEPLTMVPTREGGFAFDGLKRNGWSWSLRVTPFGWFELVGKADDGQGEILERKALVTSLYEELDAQLARTAAEAQKAA